MGHRRSQILQEIPNIVNVVEHVIEDDIVRHEILGYFCLVDFDSLELELGMFPPRQNGQGLCHVQPNRRRRLEQGEQVAGPTAELKYPCPGWHHPPDELGHLAMVEAILLVPVIPDGRDALEVFAGVFAAHQPTITTAYAQLGPSAE